MAAGASSYGRRIAILFSIEGIIMIQRKVDVMDETGKILHTYPITLGASNTSMKDADYEQAALSAARVAGLVPESEFAGLKTRLQ